MTSTSTGSAWGPRDWSSHGGGVSWEEPPADAAPTPGAEHDRGTASASGASGSRDSGSRDSGFERGGFEAYPSRDEAFEDDGFGCRSPSGERRGRRRSSRRGSRHVAAAADFEAEAERSAGDQAPSDPASRARDICLRLLTGSARTRRQLADALRRKEIPDEVAEQVLDRLTEVGLIDDAAYARSWVEQRQRSRGLARRALAGELRAKGVDSALVAEAVAEVDPDDEEAAARRLVERKLASTRGLDRQVRLRRLAGMLARRGYPEGLALRVVRAMLDAEDVEDVEDADGLDDGFLESGEQ